jgi:hypothetical protein
MDHNQLYQAHLIKSIFGKTAMVKKHNQNTQAALNIYSNNYIENGIRALTITYPTVNAFIGPESFRILSKKLLQHEHKVSFDWAEYGQSLAGFIEEQEALETYPFLSEVAELDWAIHCSQREKDKDFYAASFSMMETGDTSALIFDAAPGLQVIKCWFQVVDLYQLIHDPFLQSEEGAIARQALLKNITKSINSAINSESPRSLVLWRADYKAQFEFVSNAEAAVIQAIIQKVSVDALIETINLQNIDLVEWLTKAISNKIIFAVV